MTMTSPKKPTTTALHIAISLRVVRKHRNSKSINVDSARQQIKTAALSANVEGETKADRDMRAELERRTGVSIAELAAIAEHWD